MMTVNEDLELLKTFIDIYDAELSTGKRASFWSSNHHRVSPLVGKAERLLAPADYQRLLTHLMRISYRAWPAPKKNFSIVPSAYADILPFFDDRSFNSLRRHVALFLFGFDEVGALPSGPTTTGVDYEDLRTFITYAESIQHIPSMIEKVTKFAAFPRAGARAYETLKHLNYRHDRSEDEHYDHINLTFWAMVFTVLLTPAHQVALLHDFLDPTLILPKKPVQFDVLERLAVAALKHAATPDVAFSKAVQDLCDQEYARRDNGESGRFNKALDLRFSMSDDWQFEIMIPDASHGQFFRHPRCTLEVRRSPHMAWSVGLSDHQDRRYSEHNGLVNQNDMGITPLGAGNLQKFPAWAAEASAKVGVTLDKQQAHLACGKNRHAAKVLRAWLLAA